MKVVFFTSDGFDENEVFRYMFAHVASSFDDVSIVAVRRPIGSWLERYRQKLRRIRRFGSGTGNTVELISSYPLQRLIIDRNERGAQEAIRALPRPPLKPEDAATMYVETVNGPDAVGALRKLQPDVIVQFAAGILQEQVFEVARLGTLNLHPGIAPLIKGRDPIYWALWKREPRWLGATVHLIDEGIDTGPVLAYAPVTARYPGERYPNLFARVYEHGVERLVEVLLRLERGEHWKVEHPEGERVYRSTISGWKLGVLELRGALSRRLYRRRAKHADKPAKG